MQIEAGFLRVFYSFVILYGISRRIKMDNLMGVQWRRGMQTPLLRRRSRTHASSTVDGGDVRGDGGLLGRLFGDRRRRGAAPTSRDGGKGGVWRCVQSGRGYGGTAARGIRACGGGGGSGDVGV
jgi:hypothetical protein